ncbi:MAG: hypothetical protein ABMB14_36530, partial [Myxococcota bacterium]
MITFVRTLPDTAADLVAALAAAGVVPETSDPRLGPALRPPGAVARTGDHALVPVDAGLAEAAAAIRAAGARPWAIATTGAEVARAAAVGVDLWLRGLEAGGPVGDTTALVLIRAAAQTDRAWVAEGLSIRAIAAALAVGAAGFVLDAALWLTAGSPLSDAHRAALRTASGGHDTSVAGELAGSRERRLIRGPVTLAAPQSVIDAKTYDGRPTLDAVLVIQRDLGRMIPRIARHHPLRRGLDPLGTGRPVVQGPMANVSEGTGLAIAVRAAGGMPFAALGALDPDQAAKVLAAWASAVPAPWGVGVIGFDVMPYRDAHLASIAALGPRGPAAVTLAGGSTALAAALVARGMTPWL